MESASMCGASSDNLKSYHVIILPRMCIGLGVHSDPGSLLWPVYTCWQLWVAGWYAVSCGRRTAR